MADAHAHAKPQHDYHIIDPSPWPFIGSIGALVMAIGGVAWMQYMKGNEFHLFGLNIATPWLFFIGLAIVLYTMFSWWSDTIREGHEGHHTKVVSLHLRYGMIMFIASEVMFFVAWFWAFFDASLFPGEVAAVRPRRHSPAASGRRRASRSSIPSTCRSTTPSSCCLSGTTVTWAHHALLHNDRKGLVNGLLLTVALGVLFSIVQAYEYMHAPFSFHDSIYGATFFMATGFHGFHVLIGTIFLLVCLMRAMGGDFTPKAHFGFEAAAWYWHFVDVVWLFLFASIYVWASAGATIAAGH